MKHKVYSVSVYPPAEQKLAAHVEFLALVSENAAQNLYEAYEESLNFLETSPETCPIYLPNPKYRYKLLSGRYRIVFAIDGQIVYVYDIQDCRQDSDKNFV